MKRKPMSVEERQALSEKMKAKWASLSPEEHAAAVAKFRDPLKAEHAHEQLTKFWAGCTGEARARKCAHLTNPEAQAKSHAAQRTPEFLAKRAAWGRAAWERKTPEERAAAVEKRRETMRLKRIARGLPLVTPRKSRAKLSPEERLAVQRATMARFWENHPEIRERAAAKRTALEKKRQDRVAERTKRIAEREKARKVRAAERAKRLAEREKARKVRAAERARKAVERENARKAKAAERAKRLAERENARKVRAAERAKKAVEREKTRKAKAAERAKRIAERLSRRKNVVAQKRSRGRELKNTKAVVGISKRTGERIRFNSMLAAAEHLHAQGETTSVVAAQQIISQVCHGHRRTGFGYYWEFPHRGRPVTLETRKRRT